MSKTNAENEHMREVAGMGCLYCLLYRGIHDVPCDVHHCGTYSGGGRDHFRTAGLCPMDHRFKPVIKGKDRTEIEARLLEYVAEHCPCTTCKEKRNEAHSG